MKLVKTIYEYNLFWPGHKFVDQYKEVNTLDDAIYSINAGWRPCDSSEFLMFTFQKLKELESKIENK